MSNCKKTAYTPACVFRKLILAWIFVSTLQYCLLGGEARALQTLDGVAALSMPLTFGLVVAVFAGVLLLGRFLDTAKAERYCMLICVAIYAFFAATSTKSIAFSVTALLVVLLFAVYAVYGQGKTAQRQERPKKCHRIWYVALGLCAPAFFAAMSIWTVGRIWRLETPTYDFGLFAQMFHNMKTTGLANTTLERDGLLSHFSVHVSPIYYLMLPFYALVPRPETLQVLQALILTSSVIPLWLIARRHGLGGGGSFLVCLMLLLYPAFGGGVSYDLHENAFLTPLLFWLFYFLENRKLWGIGLFALLTLMVKEDAAVYVAVVGLWWAVKALLGEKEKRTRDILAGLGLLIAALLWFLLVTAYLNNVGEGVMTDRYENFDYTGDSSLLSVVKTCVLLPMKAIFECVDEEKLLYILQTMVPLLALPLLTRRFERLILLIPYFLVNLMPDYVYQHSVYFQYNFGSLACLFYLTVVNLSDLLAWAEKRGTVHLPMARKITAMAAVLTGVGFFSAIVCPIMAPVLPLSREEKAANKAVYDFLLEFSPESKICSTTCFTTGLSGRAELYDIEFCSEETWKEHVASADYIILDKNQQYTFYNLRVRAVKTYGELEEELLRRDFVIVQTVEDRAVVFRHP